MASLAQGSCPWYQPHIHSLYLDLTSYLVWIPALESGDGLTIVVAVVQPLNRVLLCDPGPAAQQAPCLTLSPRVCSHSCPLSQ